MIINLRGRLERVEQQTEISAAQGSDLAGVAASVMKIDVNRR